MGKSNRIRTNRAGATLSGVAPRKKREMPSWALNLITIAVAAIIVLSVAISLMSANGVFPRMQTAMKSENFRVNRNMMSYYLQTQYSSFVSQNNSYLSYYGLDTSLSLKDQVVDTKEDGSEYTWFDYMADQTKTQVKQMLVYCEEALERGIELDAEDEKYIDDQVATLEEYAAMYGYNTNSYIASMYGKGVKEGDVRDALELSRLASKCTLKISEEIEAGVSEDDVNAEYAANAKDYNLVDHLSYAITVNYSDAAAKVLGKTDYTDDELNEKKDEILTEYKAMIDAARQKAEALNSAADEKAYKDLVAEYEADRLYDSTYDTALADSDVASDKVPEKAVTDSIRTKLIAKILEAVKTDAEFDNKAVVSDDNVALEEFTVDEKYGKMLEEFALSLYNSVKGSVEKCLTDGASYTDADSVVEWAFEEGRAVGDSKIFESGDGADGAEFAENADELELFSASVARLLKTPYRSEDACKNIAIMVFDSTENAQAAIAALSDGVTVEQFEEICNANGGSFTKYENYMKGALSSAELDAWLYDDETKVGSYTQSYISVDQGTAFAVGLYISDGSPEWFVTVKNSVRDERAQELDAKLLEKHEVTIKDKVIAKIDA